MQRKYTVESVGPQIEAFLKKILNLAGLHLNFEVADGNAPHPEIEDPEVVVRFDGADVDLRPALMRAKDSGRVYHKTDTHWNDAGALVAAPFFPGVFLPSAFFSLGSRVVTLAIGTVSTLVCVRVSISAVTDIPGRNASRSLMRILTSNLVASWLLPLLPYFAWDAAHGFADLVYDHQGGPRGVPVGWLSCGDPRSDP